MSPGWVGCHPSSSRVSALEAGLSSREEAGQPGEVLACVLGGDGDHREVEMPADHLGDVADRHALVGDRVQRRSRRGLLQRQAEEARGIEPVHGGPAVGPVADVAGDALVAGDADQGRHEAVVSVAVNRRRKSHDGRADAAGSEGERHLRIGQPGRRTAAQSAAAGSGPCPSRSVATRPGASPSVPEAMTNGRSEPASASPKVSTARRSASAAPWKSPEKAMSCLNARWITPSDAAAALRRLSRSSRVPRCTSAPAAVEGSGRGIRAGQPDDLMARADELGNDGGADPAGRAGDENAHEKPPGGRRPRHRG